MFSDQIQLYLYLYNQINYIISFKSKEYDPILKAFAKQYSKVRIFVIKADIDKSTFCAFILFFWRILIINKFQNYKLNKSNL